MTAFIPCEHNKYPLYCGECLAREAIAKALSQQKEEMVAVIESFFKQLPYGQSGNSDYDRGWDDCRRSNKSSILTLIKNQ